MEHKKPRVADLLEIKTENKFLFCIICQEFAADEIDLTSRIKNNMNNLILLLYKKICKVKWETIGTILRFILKDGNIFIKIIMPYITEEETISESEKLTIIKEYHDTPLGSHQGVTRTYKRMKMFYTWKTMKSTITKYIKKCCSCQKN